MNTRSYLASKALLLTMVAAPAAILGGLAWDRHLNAPPTADVPNPTMPSPNATNTLLEASAQVVRTKDVDNAIASKPQPHEHAYTPAERANLVAANATALATVRRALGEPFENKPMRRFDQLLPELAKYRGLARLLLLESEVREANGDYAGAVDSNLDAIQLGVMVPRGGVVIHGLVGIACQAIGEKSIWKMIDHLNADQAAAAARRLETIDSQSVPYVETMRQEKWGTEASLVNELRHKSNYDLWREIAVMNGTDDSGSPKLSLGESFAVYQRLALISKQDVVDHYGRWMDAQIAAADQPYSLSPPKIASPSDPINQVIAPVMDQAQFKWCTTRLNNGLLTCALALRAYQARHGAYPADLAALVSDGLLTRVPADPFAPTKDSPFHYQQKADGTFLLYSVGPDGIDNGGAPVDLTKGNISNRNFLQKDDQGDWVYGVNTPHPSL